jgi:hypothetical protein
MTRYIAKTLVVAFIHFSFLNTDFCRYQKDAEDSGFWVSCSRDHGHHTCLGQLAVDTSSMQVGQDIPYTPFVVMPEFKIPAKRRAPCSKTGLTAQALSSILAKE